MIYRDVSGYDCPATREGDDNTECKLVTFARTPRMSSYLVAFAIGIWNKQNTTNNDKTPQSVFYPPTFSQARAEFALEQSIAVLNEFEKPDVFGIPYNVTGLTKLDSIGVSDFAAGGMDPWTHFVFYEIFVVPHRI